jgi:uncharacterized protein YjbI with pentapeptide repeats
MNKPTPEKLEEILEKHGQWLESGGSRGEKCILRGARLRGTDLVKADLRRADFSAADLTGAVLRGANLAEADLSEAYLSGTDLSSACLSEAYLSGAYLSMANLRSADLSRADLSGASLIEADLHSADLNEADLSECNLRNTDLGAANLCQADLSDANLLGVDLRGADLSMADLSRADLSLTNLVEARLYDTDLKCVKLYKTTFGFNNLARVKNLTTCIHLGPCVVDHHTLFLSGVLPLSFMRGIGLPDKMIRALPAKRGTRRHPIPSCFISYSHHDEMFSKRIHSDLQDKGIRCWLLNKEIATGYEYDVSFLQSMPAYQKLVLIISEHAIQNSWIQNSVATILEQESGQKLKILFPIRIDNTVQENRSPWVEKLRKSREIMDFTQWQNRTLFQNALKNLIQKLRE